MDFYNLLNISLSIQQKWN